MVTSGKAGRDCMSEEANNGATLGTAPCMQVTALINEERSKTKSRRYRTAAGIDQEDRRTKPGWWMDWRLHRPIRPLSLSLSRRRIPHCMRLRYMREMNKGRERDWGGSRSNP
jgi:hypothetical protein